MHSCPKCSSEFSRKSNLSRHIDECHRQSKIKINIRSRSRTHKIDQIKEELRKEIAADLRQEIKNLPPQQHITNNIFNIVVGPDAYSQLINKYGKEQAISILAHNNTIGVAKTLYFKDNKPNEYPIACKDTNHFRFINDQHEIIDDQGGVKVKDVVAENVKNAMILAANDLILTEEYGKHSYLQGKLLHDGDGKYLIQELAKIAFNPSHPFFEHRVH